MAAEQELSELEKLIQGKSLIKNNIKDYYVYYYYISFVIAFVKSILW